MLRDLLRRIFRSRWEREAERLDAKMSEEPSASEDEKRRFHDAGMKACVRCGGAVSKWTHGRNARADGDAYGIDRFMCVECPFSVDFAWDEQGSGPHYYEM